MGLPILYHYLNNLDGVIAERVFSPAKDLENILRREKIPLFSLENKKSIKDFDILGFSLLSELTYTNLLNILELSQIEIFSKKRLPEDPIIFAGGVNVFNPEPLVPFVDIFYIGDAEANFFKIIEKIRNLKWDKTPKKEILESLKNEKGVYIPNFYPIKKTKKFVLPKINKKIKKAYLKNIDDFPLPTKPIVPNTETVKFINSDLRRVNTSHAVFTNVEDENTVFYGKKPWGGEPFKPDDNIYQAGSYDG
jgi:hypothetical protein